jgi:hypothetical protein
MCDWSTYGRKVLCDDSLTSDMEIATLEARHNAHSDKYRHIRCDSSTNS